VPIILICSRASKRTDVEALVAAGVEVITVQGENEAARVCSALDELGSREIQSVLLEGGPHLAGAFLEAGEIDEARVFIAPLLAGGREAKTALEGEGFEQIDLATRALTTEVEKIDEDVLISARLKEW
jgi:diaminohydroxyphosphoribosylaminopyrimidine deaminase/5-amino-6-(5-phosphoribosylamino)uracil reductase